jgi:hypothetical protein
MFRFEKASERRLRQRRKLLLTKIANDATLEVACFDSKKHPKEDFAAAPQHLHFAESF